MSSRCAALLISAAALLLGGCVAPGMGGVSTNREIAGGQTIRIDFDSKGVVHSSNEDVEIMRTDMVPNYKDKTVRYGFVMRIKRPETTLRRVTVEDVSDDEPVVLLDDQAPKIDPKRFWSKLLEPFVPTPATARFLFELENTMRIYRFTVITGDGRKEVLYQAANYPAFIKHFLRVNLGLEKIDKR